MTADDAPPTHAPPPHAPPSPTDLAHRSYKKDFDDQCHVTARRVDDNQKARLHLQKLSLCGSGAFSNVYKGVCVEEGQKEKEAVPIAVKKTWADGKMVGEPNSVEINILRLLRKMRHKNTVQLLYCYTQTHQYKDSKEHVKEKTCYSLIFEYLPMNLHAYLKLYDRRIPAIEAKLFAWQLFRGQAHLQQIGICHRDIKPQNLLVNPDTGILKITDFGSSTTEHTRRRQPSYHVTRYYRPPELLLESRHYTCGVDVWSCACVWAEMTRGAIFFVGRTTDDQLQVIVDALGLPSGEDMTSMGASGRKMEKWKKAQGSRVDKYAEKRKPRLDKMMNMPSSQSSPECVSLLERLFVYPPTRRLCGSPLLLDPYWDELFHPGVKRDGGQPIALCLTEADRTAVRGSSAEGAGSGGERTPVSVTPRQPRSKESASREQLSRETTTPLPKERRRQSRETSG